MTDPTTQDVKRAYAWGLSGTSRTAEECDQEFDRWLNEIRAEAWDKGYTSGLDTGLIIAENVRGNRGVLSLENLPSPEQNPLPRTRKVV